MCPAPYAGHTNKFNKHRCLFSGTGAYAKIFVKVAKVARVARVAKVASD
jgi:hypothetical protein